MPGKLNPNNKMIYMGSKVCYNIGELEKLETWQKGYCTRL